MRLLPTRIHNCRSSDELTKKARTIIAIEQMRFVWLNDITDDDFNFFGLEVELWKIGNSDVAPKFNVVCKPNDWTRSIVEGAKSAEKSAMTPAKQLQVEFWKEFRNYVETNGASFRTTKPHPQNWMNISIGRSGFKLNAIASLWDSESESYDKHEIRAEVEIQNADSAAYFAKLHSERIGIETEFNGPLTWYEREGTRLRRIYVRKSVDLYNKEQWPAYFEWLRSNLDKLILVFASRIRNLTLP